MTTAASVSRRDVVIAVALSLLGIGLMILNVINEDTGGDDASLLAVPTFLAVTAPLAWRRRMPITALAAALAALLAHIALFGQLTRCGVVFPTVFIFVFAAATWLQRRDALVGLVLGLAIVVAVALSDQQIDATVIPMFGSLTAVMWGIGRVVRSRGRMVQTLEAQTDELRDARDERARLEVATDRARLSAELDELLQRRLGELARLAGKDRSDDDPVATTATLASIEHQGRRTLEEMRAVVGVLRDDHGDAPTAPQPTLTHLEAMLLRSKGAAARLTVTGSPRVLPAGVELSAYRIVEHLLGALDDAPGVDVEVRFYDDALELTVIGPTRRGSGAALERARERARLHHGTIATTVRDGRATTIASLPVAAA
ncbi:MAG: hypothetical protein WKF48_11530 [Solirubrobacteraceae bacterium]